MPDLTPRDKQELSNKDDGADEEYDERKSRGMMAHSGSRSYIWLQQCYSIRYPLPTQDY